MIPHPIALGSFALGIPQGLYLAIRVSKWIGLSGGFELILAALGVMLGICLGYAEMLVVFKVWRKS
jgi:hypothetical protein